ASIKDLARQLAKFQHDNPDCNAPAMAASLIEFLREIALADGVLDEREDLAIDAVAAAMAQASPGMIEQVQGGAARAWSSATATLGGLARKIGSIDVSSINPLAKGAKDYSRNTINTQMSKVRKLDRVFGDLDQIGAAGGLDQLQARLKAGDDLPDGLGNDGELGHLPTSLRYYRRFLEGGTAPGRDHGHAELIARLTVADIEATMDDCDAAGIDGFLRPHGYIRPSNWAVRPSN
ncbi:hypothetical protein LTR94_029471, partial [Friedmanniomyces endolithicus]